MESYEQTRELDEDSAIPLYVQLSELVRRKIRTGKLVPGDRLPSQREFCEMYDVSNITVTQAMRKLVEDGLLYRKRGKGTFVSEPKVLRDLTSIYSFTGDMNHLGLKPSSKVLNLAVVAAHDVAYELQLPSSEGRATRITRLRLAQGTPLLLEDTYIPYELAPSLVDEDLETNSLYAVLKEHYSIEVASAVETIEGVVLSSEEADLLKCPMGCAGFHIERIAYDATGIPVEFTSSITRADRCRFQISWDQESFSLRRNLAVSERLQR